MTHIASMDVLDKLGFKVEASTPKLDAAGADFFADGIPVQVRSKKIGHSCSVESTRTHEGRVERILIRVNGVGWFDNATNEPTDGLVEEIKTKMVLVGLNPKEGHRREAKA